MTGDNPTCPRPRALVVGLGNPYRHDDAVGLAVAAMIRQAGLPGVQVEELEGEPVSLIGTWDEAAAVYVIDAVFSGGQPGTVYRVDAATELAPAPLRHRGTHAFSISDVIALASALGCLPPRLTVYGIEGAGFGAGVGLSPSAASAAEVVAGRLMGEITAQEG